MIYRDVTKHLGCLVALDEKYRAAFKTEKDLHQVANSNEILMWLGGEAFLLRGQKVVLSTIEFRERSSLLGDDNTVYSGPRYGYTSSFDPFIYFSLV